MWHVNSAQKLKVLLKGISVAFSSVLVPMVAHAQSVSVSEPVNITLPSPGNPMISDSFATPDLGLLICGELVQENSSRFFVSKLNQDWSVAWFRTYNFAANGRNKAVDMDVAQDGTIFVVGWSEIGTTDSRRAVRARYAPNGQQLWLNRNAGLEFSEYTSVQALAPGTFAAGGKRVFNGAVQAFWEPYFETGPAVFSSPWFFTGREFVHGFQFNIAGDLVVSVSGPSGNQAAPTTISMVRHDPQLSLLRGFSSVNLPGSAGQSSLIRAVGNHPSAQQWDRQDSIFYQNSGGPSSFSATLAQLQSNGTIATRSTNDFGQGYQVSDANWAGRGDTPAGSLARLFLSNSSTNEVAMVNTNQGINDASVRLRIPGEFQFAFDPADLNFDSLRAATVRQPGFNGRFLSLIASPQEDHSLVFALVRDEFPSSSFSFDWLGYSHPILQPDEQIGRVATVFGRLDGSANRESFGVLLQIQNSTGTVTTLRGLDVNLSSNTDPSDYYRIPRVFDSNPSQRTGLPARSLGVLKNDFGNWFYSAELLQPAANIFELRSDGNFSIDASTMNAASTTFTYRGQSASGATTPRLVTLEFLESSALDQASATRAAHPGSSTLRARLSRTTPFGVLSGRAIEFRVTYPSGVMNTVVGTTDANGVAQVAAPVPANSGTGRAQVAIHFLGDPANVIPGHLPSSTTTSFAVTGNTVRRGP